MEFSLDVFLFRLIEEKSRTKYRKREKTTDLFELFLGEKKYWRKSLTSDSFVFLVEIRFSTSDAENHERFRREKIFRPTFFLIKSFFLFTEKIDVFFPDKDRRDKEIFSSELSWKFQSAGFFPSNLNKIVRTRRNSFEIFIRDFSLDVRSNRSRLICAVSLDQETQSGCSTWFRFDSNCFFDSLFD